MKLSKLMALGLIATLGAAGNAAAQSVSLSYGQQTRHGSFSIGLTAPLTSECSPVPTRVWVPGHYQEVERQVWVEGQELRQWVAPVYETRFDDCGRPFSVLVREGYWDTFCEPGHFELRSVRVWVDGFWRTEVAQYGGPSLDLRYERREERTGDRGRGRQVSTRGPMLTGGAFDAHRFDRGRQTSGGGHSRR